MGETDSKDNTGEEQLTKEQLDAVAAILQGWAKAGMCLLQRKGDPSMGTVTWEVPVDGLVRMLHTLAHCAALTGLQGLVTGRSEENRSPDMAIGFIATAKAVEYLANRCSTKVVTLCSSDPHEYLNPTWNEIAKSRDYVLNDIERVAPGWYAKAQELAAAMKKEPLAKPLTEGYPEVKECYGPAGWTVLPEGSAERIASAKAGICVTERGDIRLNNVTHRLYEHLGHPHELLGQNYEGAVERIKSDLSLKWLSGLTDFIGGYEEKYGERLGDAELRYLHELVRGDMTPERRKGYARLAGLEKRDVRFRPEDFK